MTLQRGKEGSKVDTKEGKSKEVTRTKPGGPRVSESEWTEEGSWCVAVVREMEQSCAASWETSRENPRQRQREKRTTGD